MKKTVIILLALAMAGLFGWAIVSNANRAVQRSVTQQQERDQTQAAPAPGTPETPGVAGAPEAPAPPPAQEVAPTTAPAAQGPATAPATQAATAPAPAGPQIAAAPLGLHPLPPRQAQPVRLGFADQPQGPYHLLVDLTSYGAAIHSVALTNYRTEALAQPTDYYKVINPVQFNAEGTGGRLYPYAARAVDINGQSVSLQKQQWDLLDSTATRAVYGLTLADGTDQPVLQIRRTWTITQGSYDLTLEQELINLTNAPLQVTWEQNLQGDLPEDGGRAVAAGYLNPSYDKERRFVYSDGAMELRDKFVSRWIEEPKSSLWPLPKVDAAAELVWLSTLNRYFVAVTRPQLADPQKKIEPLPAAGLFPQLLGDGDPHQQAMVLALRSPLLIVPAAGKVNYNLTLFAGPRERAVFSAQPYQALGFPQMVVYAVGCDLCTFQWLAQLLLSFLHLIHDYLVFDWGVAIIVLVLVVRIILHPITRKSQINMMKMGKQMQSLAPEMEKLKKKYADDPGELNKQTMQLYRDKGINPANMLGCLPMLLQMPIWAALYAMLFTAIELRHQPAFYSVFQNISGGHWAFLADLSSPDNFIRFGTIKLNLFFFSPEFSGINILPIIWAVVMFVQQKMMQTPAANEQQAQQQKIMQYMTLLFPFMLFNTPSGLTLYLVASTAAGIVDSYLVRRHIKQQEEAGVLLTPKKPRKPGGWMDRLYKIMEEQQNIAEQRRKSGPGPRPDDRRKK